MNNQITTGQLMMIGLLLTGVVLAGCTEAEMQSYMDNLTTNNTEDESSGVSDQDGDGVADGDDYCPYEPGSASNNGCPTQDGGGDDGGIAPPPTPS